METTVDINALRNELAREILETEDRILLEKIRAFLAGCSSVAAEEQMPYTVEEIRSWAKKAEDEIRAGVPGKPWEEFKAEMRRKHPELCVLG